MNSETLFLLTMLVGLVIQILLILFLVKHTKYQEYFIKWSDNRMTRHGSVYNKRLFYGFALQALVTITWNFTPFIFNLLIGNTTTNILIQSAMSLVVIALFWLGVSKRNTGKFGFDRLSGFEILYGFVASSALITIFALFGGFWYIAALFSLIFWFKYDAIKRWFQKWSDNEFTAPDSQFNFNLFHGIGLLVTIIATATIGILLGNLLTKLMGYPNVSILDASVIFAGIIFCVPLGAYLYWRFLYNRRKDTGATEKAVRWELFFSLLVLAAWATGIALIVIVVPLYILLRLISYFCFGEEITVKTGGLFGGSKKVYAERNLDGSYTDIEGKTYK